MLFPVKPQHESHIYIHIYVIPMIHIYVCIYIYVYTYVYIYPLPFVILVITALCVKEPLSSDCLPAIQNFKPDDTMDFVE